MPIGVGTEGAIVDMWLTYVLLGEGEGPGGECEAGPVEEPRRELFTFTETEPGYGPTIGEMARAIRERHGGRDGVVLRTDSPEDVEG